MLHTATIDALRSWEETFPVATWRIDDVPVWPLVRCRLGARLLAAGRPLSRTDSPSPLAASLTRLKSLLDMTRPLAKPDGTCDVLMLTRPANRQFVNGHWYDRLLDPIADAIESTGSCVRQLEYTTADFPYRVPRFRRATPIRAAVARRRIAAALQTLSAPRLDGFDEFVNAVRRQQPAIRVPSPRWLSRSARAINLIARDFEQLLERAHARIAMTCVYYTQVAMALCLAARRRNILAVDVQHGVTSGNYAYDGWSRVPSEGWSLLPSLFWCWSDDDARAVNSWSRAAGGRHRTVVGGHPWFAVCNSDQPIARAAAKAVPDRQGASIIVLVTLSWSSGLSDRLKRIVEQAPASWTWWLRLHPLMNHDRPAIAAWARAHGGRIVVDEATDLPLPLLLEHANVHVTHNSSVVQEAARVGTPSVVIDSRALDVYSVELGSGWAVFADHTADVHAAIASQVERRASLPPRSRYPSWTDLSRVVQDLLSPSSACPATASAASFPTPAPA